MVIKVKRGEAVITEPWAASFAHWFIPVNGVQIGPFATMEDAIKAQANLVRALTGKRI